MSMRQLKKKVNSNVSDAVREVNIDDVSGSNREAFFLLGKPPAFYAKRFECRDLKRYMKFKSRDLTAKIRKLKLTDGGFQ
jgi:hypothetical protein